ncbi:MAG: hypothetical protein QOE60_2012 [Thermoleophilaceae bacterium]|nr:hypothetical protein [Thermoleophilaceae bacterium]
MGATLTEQPGTGISPPLRPSVWAVGWATFVGYFLTVLVGLPIAFLLSTVGVDVWGDGRGVFHAYDVWSWLAEASVGVLATFVTAYFVGDSVRRRTGWEVPFSFAFVALLLTGYAPLLALTPLYGAAAPVSLIAATLLLHWRAAPAGAEPLKMLGAVPRRYRRGVVLAVAVAGPLMFAYVLAYGTTHPLRWGYGHTYKPGKLMRYELALENGGQAAVSDISITRVEGSPALQLERVGIEGSGACVVPEGHRTCAPPMHPIGRDYLLGHDRPITLELRQGHVCPSGVASLDAVWVRYTVLGTRQEQRIPLEQPPRVRCP